MALKDNLSSFDDIGSLCNLRYKVAVVWGFMELKSQRFAALH
jgi:hypothetical protein